jgi:hypothetical protein
VDLEWSDLILVRFNKRFFGITKRNFHRRWLFESEELIEGGNTHLKSKLTGLGRPFYGNLKKLFI